MLMERLYLAWQSLAAVPRSFQILKPEHSLLVRYQIYFLQHASNTGWVGLERAVMTTMVRVKEDKICLTRYGH